MNKQGYKAIVCYGNKEAIVKACNWILEQNK